MKIFTKQGVIDVYENNHLIHGKCTYQTISGKIFKFAVPKTEAEIDLDVEAIFKLYHETIAELHLHPFDYKNLILNPKEWPDNPNHKLDCRCSAQSLLFAGHDPNCPHKTSVSKTTKNTTP